MQSFPIFAQWHFHPHQGKKGQLQYKTGRDNPGVQKREMLRSTPEFPHLMAALPSPKQIPTFLYGDKGDANHLNLGRE